MPLKTTITLFLLSTLPIISGCSKVILHEDWQSLNASKWHIYGEPKPFLYKDSASRGTFCFANNGDSAYPSGAVYREPFELVPNMTISFYSKLHAEGSENRNFNQHNDIWLTTSPLENFDADQKAEGVPAWIRHHAGPRNKEHESGCVIFYGKTRKTLDAEPDFGRWVKFTMKTQPDGSVKYYKNGKFVSKTQPGTVSYESVKKVRLVVSGKSAGTVLLVDDVKVEVGR